MKTQKISSKIEYRAYCEACQAEFMTEDPAKACPVCEVRKKRESKKNNKKGSGKND